MNPLRRLGARYDLLGIVHYCLPTLLLGTALRLRALFRVRRRGCEPTIPNSIIVFRLDGIGDVVLSSGMLRELRRLYAHAHITIVVSTGTRSLLEDCPYVDEVLDKPTGSNSLASVFANLRTTLAFCRKTLCQRRWDLAIVPRWDADTYFAGLMCLYIGATRRIAFSDHSSPRKHHLNWGFNSLYTDVLPPGPLKHEAERNLDIVRYLGGRIQRTDLELWLTPVDHADVDKCWRHFGLAESSKVIAFGVGADSGRRRWPAHRFAALIDGLCSTGEFRPAIICGPNDAGLVREIQQYSGSELIVPSAPSLRQTAALLSRCVLFIGNDSGPMHVAAAVGLPVVEISCHPAHADPEGTNSPERFGPFTKRRAIVKPPPQGPPCVKGCTSAQPHCITKVSVAEVASAACRLLGAGIVFRGARDCTLNGITPHYEKPSTMARQKRAN
jgi:ADP-heptose:LPS heptosyltransferase